MLAFLSSGCAACIPFWEGLVEMQQQNWPGEARIVVVAKDRDYESPSRLRDLTPPGTVMVLSSPAYADYGVETSPYFIYIEGVTGQVASEGSATTWAQVMSLLRDAIGDQELAREQVERVEGVDDG